MALHRDCSSIARVYCQLLRHAREFLRFLAVLPTCTAVRKWRKYRMTGCSDQCLVTHFFFPPFATRIECPSHVSPITRCWFRGHGRAVAGLTTPVHATMQMQSTLAVAPAPTALPHR